jgi:hypothetical protein
MFSEQVVDSFVTWFCFPLNFICNENPKAPKEYPRMFSIIDSSSGFTEIKTRKRESTLKGGESVENPTTYLSLIFLHVGRIYYLASRILFSFFPSLVLLMSRDWKHFSVRRFVHVMPLAISSPLNLKCPHYNDFNPLPAGLQHAVQSKLFFQYLKGSNNRNKEVHSRPKESERFPASIKHPVRWIFFKSFF